MLRFSGHKQFRHRVVCAVLANKNLKISNIREKDSKNPGLREYEVNFLKLVSELTNGTVTQISSTGTTLTLKPGLITGTGPSVLEFETASELRSIMYYIEGILPLVIFTGATTQILFKGKTECDLDWSIEQFNEAVVPFLKNFGIEVNNLKLKKRANLIEEGSISLIQQGVSKANVNLNPVQLVDPGFIRKIRGVAYTVRVSPQFSNRAIDSARSVLNNFIPDVYISTDATKSKAIGDAGFGMTLYAESTTECVVTSRLVVQEGKDMLEPEELGLRTAKLLCEEVAKGGCCDSAVQGLAVLCMALGKQVSKIRFGGLTQNTKELLKLIYDVFGVKFKIRAQETSPFREDEEAKEVDVTMYDSYLLSCKGVGLENMARIVS